MISPDPFRVAVELTDHELRWLWYSCKGKGKSKLVPARFEITLLPPGLIRQGKVLQPEEFISILKSYLEKCKVESKLHSNPRIRIGLSLHNQFIREYSLPWVKKGNRAGLIRYLAEEEIPIPKDELIYDYFLEEQKSSFSKLQVILSGIRQSILVPITSNFRAAGFEIEKVSFSQLAWAKVLDFGSGENTLFLREDEGQVQYIFYKGKIPEIIRSFPAAVHYYGEDEWNNEIHRMLLYLSSLHEQVELSRILWGHGRETEEVGERIGKYLQRVRGEVPTLQGVDAACFDFVSSRGLDALRSAEPEKLLTVLGMALEEEKYSLNNFWRVENLKKKKQQVKWIAAGVILLLNLGGYGVLACSEESLEALQVEARQLSEAIKTQVLLEGNLREQRLAWEKVVRHPSEVGQAMRELIAYNTEKIKLDRIEIQGERLLIQGVATESLEVQKVFQQLEATGWGKVQLAKYQLTESPSVEGMPIQFTLKAEHHD